MMTTPGTRPGEPSEPVASRRGASDHERLARGIWKAATQSRTGAELAAALVSALTAQSGFASCAAWIADDSSASWKFIRGSGELEIPDVQSFLAKQTTGTSGPLPPPLHWAGWLDLWRRSHSQLPEGVVARFPAQCECWTIPGEPPILLAWWGTASDRQSNDEFRIWLRGVFAEAASGRVVQTQRRQEQSRHTALTGAQGLPWMGLDSQGRVTAWCPAISRMLGWREQDALGQPCPGLNPDDLRDLRSCVTTVAFQLRERVKEKWLRCSDGQLRWIELRIIPSETSPSPEVVVLATDRTAERQAHERLHVVRQLWQLVLTGGSRETTLRSALDAVLTAGWYQWAEIWERASDGWSRTAASGNAPPEPLGPAGQVRGRMAERSAAERRIIDFAATGSPREHFGWRSARASLPESAVAAPLPGDGPVSAVLIVHAGEGVIDPAANEETLVSMTGWLAALLRMDQLSRSHDEAMHRMRGLLNLDALGLFSGGIAHDFNNLLAIILGNCELASTRCHESSTAELLSEIQSAAERAAALTRKLLSFSRAAPGIAEPLDVHQHLLALREILGRMLGPRIALELDLEDESPRVLLDSVEWEQVILNLAANARDAMPTGGQLSISTRRVTLELKDLRSQPEARPGEFLEVRVSDTGCGMEAADLARACDPLFTTKAAGRGTGLGLSVIARIVRLRRGVLQLVSRPGQGTTCALWLPLVKQAMATRVVHSPSKERLRGTERVLVVDDEPALRNIVCELLGSAGYQVRAAANGTEALRLLGESDPPVELLVSDVMMPGLSGPELSKQALRRQPGLRVLLMSGNGAATIPQGGPPLIPKPFASDGLLREVRLLLDAPCEFPLENAQLV